LTDWVCTGPAHAQQHALGHCRFVLKPLLRRVVVQMDQAALGHPQVFEPDRNAIKTEIRYAEFFLVLIYYFKLIKLIYLLCASPQILSVSIFEKIEVFSDLQVDRKASDSRCIILLYLIILKIILNTNNYIKLRYTVT
jgi:hypothetical protein